VRSVRRIASLAVPFSLALGFVISDPEFAGGQEHGALSVRVGGGPIVRNEPFGRWGLHGIMAVTGHGRSGLGFRLDLWGAVRKDAGNAFGGGLGAVIRLAPKGPPVPYLGLGLSINREGSISSPNTSHDAGYFLIIGADLTILGRESFLELSPRLFGNVFQGGGGPRILIPLTVGVRL
jgi:hypothetical protein